MLFAWPVLSQSPVANFTAAATAGCSPLVISFTDQSTGNPSTWLWDFGNGNSSTLQNPFIIYSAAAVYSITLKVTNDKGCYRALTKTNYVNVTAGVAAGFTNVQATVCRPPANIVFTNTSTGPGAL